MGGDKAENRSWFVMGCDQVFWRSISSFLTKDYVFSHCERSEAISFVRKREIAIRRWRTFGGPRNDRSGFIVPPNHH